MPEQLYVFYKRGDRTGAEQFNTFLQEFQDPIQLLKFETNLLKALSLSNGLQQEKQDAKFLSALMQLGGAYAVLKPTATSSTESFNFFLDTIWQKGNSGIQTGKQELEALLSKFSLSKNKLDFLRLGSYLLKEAKQTPQLQAQSPELLFEFIRMGRTHIALDLPVSLAWEDGSKFSFDILWQQGDLYASNLSLDENNIVNTGIVVYVFDGRSNGFSGSGGFNPFGHAAISVDGVFYNYAGERGLYRTNEAIFNEFLVRPGVRVERYWINYTGEQKAAIKEYLDRIYEGGTPVPGSFRVLLDAPYDLFGPYAPFSSNSNSDNCTTLVIDALQNTLIGQELLQDEIYAPFDLRLYLRMWSGQEIDPVLRPNAAPSDVGVVRLSDYYHRGE